MSRPVMRFMAACAVLACALLSACCGAERRAEPQADAPVVDPVAPVVDPVDPAGPVAPVTPVNHGELVQDPPEPDCGVPYQGRACCRAMTKECLDCVEAARLEREAWEKKCGPIAP